MYYNKRMIVEEIKRGKKREGKGREKGGKEGGKKKGREEKVSKPCIPTTTVRE